MTTLLSLLAAVSCASGEASATRIAPSPAMVTYGEPSAAGEPTIEGATPPADKSSSGVETGTDPAKLLRRFEVNPQYIESRGPGHLLSTNLKLDLPLTKSFATAFEVPVIHASGFPAPLDDQFGLGDIFVRVRNVWSFERSSLVAGAELGLKTADDELLGSGKWQVNPTIAHVYYVSSEYLIATAAKQRLSVAGDDDRSDLNLTELRLIGIYVNPDGWWMMADFQPKINWEDDASVSHLLEFEAGMMLNATLGFSVRPGVGLGDNRDREWSLGVGMRLFF